MAHAIQYEETIFHAARNIDSREDRSAYLTQACGDDRALRERIEKLLTVYEADPSGHVIAPQSGNPLFDQFAPSVDEPLGTVIGRYKLLERIGEGGFGVVFMAEQQHPVRRRVALK